MTALLDHSLWEWSLFVGLAVIVGGLLQGIAGYSLGGCVISLIAGFLGAMAGAWVAVQFALPAFYTLTIGSQTLPLVWPAIGAVIFVAILSLLLQRVLVDA